MACLARSTGSEGALGNQSIDVSSVLCFIEAD
jgi:hypothetical protein